MVEFGPAILGAQIAVLIGGFGFAAFADWRAREVTDHLWQVMGILGLILGAWLFAAAGALPLVMWIVVGGFTLQHMFPWTLGPRLEPYEDLVDLALYVLVILVVAGAAIRFGVGSTAVPYAVIALLVTVLFARGGFEAGLLFGGADAKALMIAGMLVPVFAVPLLYAPTEVVRVNAILPFPLSVLMNAALFSVVIPLAVVLRNASRRELKGWRSFTGYTIPVQELPRRFVWVRNPMSRDARAEEEEIETSEQDRQRRVRISRELSERGVERVWVTPQIPYLVLLAIGVVAALLAGNLVVDLITLF